MARVRVLASAGVAVAVAVAACVAALAGGEGDRHVALVELGRRLFFDPAVGRNGRVACAACHDPEHGFSDARPFSQDEDGVLPRHSQPVVDVGGAGLHWDGEFDTLRELVDARILPLPVANLATVDRALRRVGARGAAGDIDPAVAEAAVRRFSNGAFYYPPQHDVSADPVAATSSLVQRVLEGDRYEPGFRAAFGDASVSRPRIADAIEAYVGSLRSGTSAFDRFASGESAALSDAAKRGLALFRGRAGCAQCHLADGQRPALTDGKFHDTGIALRPGKDGTPPERNDVGRAATSLAAPDLHAFKTPALRDVARRAPYFHDASSPTLEDVVRYYAAGCTKDEHLDARLRPFDASDSDVADLVAFLGALTSDVRPGLGPPSPTRASRLSVHVESIDGAPVANAAVVVRAFGDRLAGTTAMPAPVTVRTDAKGDASIAMPAATHVIVEAEGAPATAPLPDWTGRVQVVVTPKDRLGLRVTFPARERNRPGHINVFTKEKSTAPPVSFAFVRNLAGSEAIYAAPASPTDEGARAAVVVWHDAASNRNVDVFVDLRAGAEGRLDLRPEAHETRDSDADRAAAQQLAARLQALREATQPR